MGYEKRQIYLDKELDIEAYWFYGIMQKFPNHFHEYYVIGFVEEYFVGRSIENKKRRFDSSASWSFRPNKSCCRMLSFRVERASVLGGRT